MTDVLADHIMRQARIDRLKDEQSEKLRAIHDEYYEKMRLDKMANIALLERCEVAFDKKLEREHNCSCCDVNLPDDYYITDHGKLQVSWDADHPNDRRFDDISIDELLKEE